MHRTLFENLENIPIDDSLSQNESSIDSKHACQKDLQCNSTFKTQDDPISLFDEEDRQNWTLDSDVTLKKAIQAKFDRYSNQEIEFGCRIWGTDFFHQQTQPPDNMSTISVIPVCSFTDVKRYPVEVEEVLIKKKMTADEALKASQIFESSSNQTKKQEVVSQVKTLSDSLLSMSSEETSSSKTAKQTSKVAVNNPDGVTSNEEVRKELEVISDLSVGLIDSTLDNESVTSLRSNDSNSQPIKSSATEKRQRREAASLKTTTKEDHDANKDAASDEKVLVYGHVIEYADNIFMKSYTGEMIASNKLEHQDQVPLINCYLSTPVNVRMPDATELQNCPYLGDNLDAKDHKFLDDLIYNFEGKLRAWGEIEDIPPPLFVDVFQLVWSSMGFDLTDPAVDTRDPPLSVIIKVGSLFNSDDHIKLRERYINFTSDKGVIRNMKDITDKRYAFKRDEAINHFEKFFCRRCYRYDCEMHDSIPLPEPTVYESDLPANNLKLCANHCYMKHHACLYHIKVEALGKFKQPFEQILKLGFVSWTKSELTLLNLIKAGHGKDICNLSTCFPLKNCFLVFLQLLNDETLQNLKYDPEVSRGTLSVTDGFLPKYEIKPGLFVVKKDQVDLVNKVLTKQHNLPKSPYYQPCVHEKSSDGKPVFCGIGSESCGCVSKNSFCDKSCNCSVDCPNRFPGCQCTKGSCQNWSTCMCLMAARECDPDLCVNCCALTDLPVLDPLIVPHNHGIHLPLKNELPSNVNLTIKNEYLKRLGIKHCQNFNLQKPNYNSKIMLGVSEVAGWGLFATFPIRPGEFIGEYRGEVVSQNEAERRGKMYDRNFNSYLFNLNSEFVVDATNKGSKMRFINHSATRANCTARVVQVCGDHRIGVYASTHIKPGHELFYNYRYSGRKKRNGGNVCDESSSEEEEEEDVEDSQEESNAGDTLKFSLEGSDDDI